MRRIKNIEEIEVGRDGIYLEQGSTGVYSSPR